MEEGTMRRGGSDDEDDGESGSNRDEAKDEKGRVRKEESDDAVRFRSPLEIAGMIANGDLETYDGGVELDRRFRTLGRQLATAATAATATTPPTPPFFATATSRWWAIVADLREAGALADGGPPGSLDAIVCACAQLFGRDDGGPLDSETPILARTRHMVQPTRRLRTRPVADGGLVAAFEAEPRNHTVMRQFNPRLCASAVGDWLLLTLTLDGGHATRYSIYNLRDWFRAILDPSSRSRVSVVCGSVPSCVLLRWRKPPLPLTPVAPFSPTLSSSAPTSFCSSSFPSSPLPATPPLSLSSSSCSFGSRSISSSPLAPPPPPPPPFQSERESPPPPPTLVCLLDAPDHYARTRERMHGGEIAYVPLAAIELVAATLASHLPRVVADLVTDYMDRLAELRHALGPVARDFTRCSARWPHVFDACTATVAVAVAETCSVCGGRCCAQHYERRQRWCVSCGQIAGKCGACGQLPRGCELCGICETCHPRGDAETCDNVCGVCSRRCNATDRVECVHCSRCFRCCVCRTTSADNSGGDGNSEKCAGDPIGDDGDDDDCGATDLLSADNSEDTAADGEPETDSDEDERERDQAAENRDAVESEGDDGDDEMEPEQGGNEDGVELADRSWRRGDGGGDGCGD